MRFMIRSAARRSVGFVLFLSIAAAPGAGFRNFSLPCLAPLLKEIDSEAPKSLSLAFLRGPTRAPELREDLGAVDFAITTKSPEAAAFFNQGVALLHGLAYADAERNFRQALSHDPDNPIVLWGLSIANELRPQRARLFAQAALRRVGKDTGARERAFIDTAARFFNVQRNGPAGLPPAEELSEEEIRERHRVRIRDLEGITLAHPDDVEAKAFLLRQLTLDEHRAGISVTSHVAVDRLARELAAAAPAHPSRHYQIFLWLNERPAMALPPAEQSAALAPGIADSWRYAAQAWRANGRHHEAVPFLEAALRVDHRHLRDHLLMPATADNLVANYAALIDTLGSMGRVDDALRWAERLGALPRELPGVSGWSPAAAARALLVETLLRAELGERLLQELAANPLLQPDSASSLDRARALYWKSVTLATLDRHDEIDPFETQLVNLSKSPESGSEREELAAMLKGLQTIRSLRLGKVPAEAPADPPHIPLNVLARAWSKAGRPAEAIEVARRNLAERPGQLLATATFCDLNFTAGERVAAMTVFGRSFRENAFRADKGLPVLKRLDPLAKEMKLSTRWMIPGGNLQIPGAPPDPPESLGPLTWSPAPAPEWSLPNHAGRQASSADFRGKPIVLHFFLGVACPYCVDQLNRFRSRLSDFEKAGIEMLAISIDPVETLAATLGTAEEKTPEVQQLFPYQILADPDLATFKAFGVFDDFEAGPMHATFLIDAAGRVLWSDVSHEPFNQPDALLNEATRLLSLEALSPAP